MGTPLLWIGFNAFVLLLLALGVVAAILVVAVVASIVAARAKGSKRTGKKHAQRKLTDGTGEQRPNSELITRLTASDGAARNGAGRILHEAGWRMSDPAIERWSEDAEFDELLVTERPLKPGKLPVLATTVGIAVTPRNFEAIRAANGSPRLAEVPPDQDAMEFELDFGDGVKLDILTTKEPGGKGAIAKFLEKFGEGVQQVEYEVRDVDRATAILRGRFGQEPIYPATRAGADGTRVNFFLAPTPDGKKVLIELVEAAPNKMHPRP